MIPWELLDTAPVPGGGEPLRLKRRGSEFSIMLGANELMNSRLSGSEEALAQLVCERLGARDRPQILIGGLGMGFTLRAALLQAPPGIRITVAELVPAVVAWARGPMADLHGASLDDPRVTIREADVADLIRAEAARYDAILLDVDNGPDGLSRPANDGLYDLTGLTLAWRALTEGGILAVWSSAPDPRFARRLRRIRFEVEEIAVRASRSRRGAKHTIWIATKRGSAS